MILGALGCVNNASLEKINKQHSARSKEFENIYISSSDDDNDEVRGVCKTPGDPSGCTRQYYQSSGLLFPSPLIKHWSVSSS